MYDVRDYAFVDGNYLRLAYETTMGAFFANVAYRNIDFERVRESLNASKVFYYDSIDEDAPDAADRQAHIEEISALDGFHVRLGSIRGSNKRRRRQKKVDVQLAVDALTHAFNKNCWHASLVAGDLDFEPLVAALIQLGVHVHVWHEPASASKDLYRAADVSVPLDVDQFWRWSGRAYQSAQPRPQRNAGHDHNGEIKVRTGQWRDKRIELYEIRSAGSFVLLAKGAGYTSSFSMVFDNPERLEKYFGLLNGPIAWDA